MGYSPWDHKRVGYNLVTTQQHILQTEHGLSQKARVALKCSVVSFYRLGDFIG